jgi:hypothetical protein
MMSIEDIIAERLYYLADRSYYQEMRRRAPVCNTNCGAAWVAIIVLFIVLTATACLLGNNGV